MSGPDDRTQALLDLIEGVIWEVDPVTRCNTYVSRKLEPIFGYSPEQWLSTPDFWDQCIHPQDQARIAVETERGLALGRPYHLEYRMLTGDGRTVWVRDVITPRFENGELKTLGGVMIDCTEQKQAQEALGTLKDHLAKVFQASPVGISISGLADGRLLDANPVFADLTGYSHQELMGRSLVGLGIWEHPDERDALVEELRNGQTVRDREVTLRARSGKSLSLLVSMERIEIDGEPCLLAISKDIGERKRAEAKLRAVEARSRSLIQNSTDVFSIVDQDGTYLYVSPSVQTVYGVDPDSVIGLRLADAVHRDDLPSAMNDLQTVLDDPERMVVSTVRMMTAGRSWRWIETTSTNLLDDPHIRGIVCSSRDVTDRKLAEQALERSEGRFRSLVQNASDIITVMDQNAVVLYVSPSVTAILGYPPSELIGRNALPYLPESECADIQRLLEDLIAAGRGAIARPTFHFRTVGGDYRCLEALATNLLDDPSVGGIVINSRDITERVLAEEALRLSQERLLSAEKLAGLGRLTAGLAHEINTPLAAAMNGLHLARGLAEEYRESIGQPGVNEQDHREIASELIARLDEVDATTARIGEFIRQMRGHTRDTVSGTTEFDPARLAADTLSMLAHEARAASVELHLEAPRGRLALRGEPGRFTQVLTNLVVNAVHACETVGHARRVDVRFLDLEGQLCLQVEDNGAGIPADVLPRIFEPMFTTKEVGKGTGLGLSIIYDIVQGHFGGEVEVQTELGRGTVFSVRFPAMTLA